MSSDILDGYWRLPPIARTVATAVFATSVGQLVGITPINWLYFSNDFVYTFLSQIWRVWTNYLFTQPQLGLLFDTYFLYTYIRALEVDNPRFSKREDVIWYLIFVSGVTTFLCSFVYPGGMFLTGLILAICRTVTQDQRGQKASIYFVTIPAQMMPFGLMLMSLIMPNGYYYLPMQICGFLASHLFDFLTRYYPEFIGGRNLAPTPAFLSRFFDTPRFFQRTYGTAIRPSDQSTGRTTGASTGPLPDAWRTRGSGRRLGE